MNWEVAIVSNTQMKRVRMGDHLSTSVNSNFVVWHSVNAIKEDEIKIIQRF